jgi:3-hydroxybutyryl-CoA dehydrogenase
MGSGIAQVCAASGFKTIVKEVDAAVLETGLGRIRKFLDEGVSKGKVTAAARDLHSQDCPEPRRSTR